ncbi:PEP-CTERM sorting domain-containing protein [Prosthecobacter sp. SYSU 5D2]|uniref:PEP-CTERM sorting domain-containing protein n=1 Tax=Prosthecobacter sp. SYSU 5D2 TaxID=3134134 RepID=UPI0031FE7049
MKVLPAVVLILLAVAPAKAATFLLTYGIGEITGLTAGVSKAMLVVDTAGDGFAGINDPNTDNVNHFDLANFSLTAGSTVGDDMAIWIATAQDLGDGLLGFDFSSQAFNTSDSVWNGLLGTNQRLGVYWFPEGTNEGGDPFGFYRTNEIEEGDRGYFTPLDGGINSIQTATPTLGGETDPNALTANNGTIGAIPEPSRMMLMLLGFAGLMMRRRRRA